MDKSKLIAVVLLVGIGGALVYSKIQDPAAPSHDDHDDDPPPAATAKPAPAKGEEAATANAAPAESGKTAPATGTGAKSETAKSETAKSETVTATKPEPDTKELKIIDQRVGTGPAANTGDQLSMNYKGTLLNGKVFDQSYGRGPFDFQLGAGNVIKGWDQGIVGMKVGGKRKLVIPADLAYGAQSPSPDIPSNSTLVFEVELLTVNGKSS